MKNVSFRIENDMLNDLDNIAKIENIDRSTLINQLINEKISLMNWQLEKIDRAISEADKGNYSQDIEIIKMLTE